MKGQGWGTEMSQEQDQRWEGTAWKTGLLEWCLGKGEAARG